MELSVVLVKPLYEGNVGSAARVMKNFGVRDLVLIKPCKLEKEASDMAVHAKEILKRAKKYSSFEAAIRGFDLVVGTTAESTDKDDYFTRIAISPEELRKKLEKVNGKMALVFGPEDSGLPNEELERCDMVVTIPTSKNYRSMNLSHAVAIILYELTKATSYKRQATSPRLSGKKEKDLIVENFRAIVNFIKYPKPKERRKIFNVMLTRIMGRAQVTGREANTLIGVLKKIKKRLER